MFSCARMACTLADAVIFPSLLVVTAAVGAVLLLFLLTGAAAAALAATAERGRLASCSLEVTPFCRSSERFSVGLVAAAEGGDLLLCSQPPIVTPPAGLGAAEEEEEALEPTDGFGTLLSPPNARGGWPLLSLLLDAAAPVEEEALLLLPLGAG